MHQNTLFHTYKLKVLGEGGTALSTNLFLGGEKASLPTLYYSSARLHLDSGYATARR